MGSCVATGVCCCFAACCSSCSDAIKGCLGPQRTTKLFYLFLVLIFVVPAIFVFFFLHNWDGFRQFFDQWLSCPTSDDFECIGASAIYRLSLSLVALFLVLTIFMICRNKCSQVINQGLFCFKYLFVVALFIAFLFVSNQTFQSYAVATKYISIIFIILQSIILIDLFYLAGIRLVRQYDSGKTQYACYIVVLTAIVETIAIFMNVYGYTQFSSTQNGTCSTTVWVNVITSIILIALPLLQLLNFNSQNSLLTTALVSLYVSYLAFIGQYSYEGDCSRLTTGTLAFDIGASTIFFILTMYGSIIGGSGQIKVTQGGDVNKAMGVAPNTARQSTLDAEKNHNGEKAGTAQQFNKSPEAQQQNQQAYTHSWDWFKWHFYMTLASIYIAVIITNWDSVSIITGDLTPSGFSFWVRIVLSWITTLIYVWTLVAPKVFPSRNYEV